MTASGQPPSGDGPRKARKLLQNLVPPSKDLIRKDFTLVRLKESVPIDIVVIIGEEIRIINQNFRVSDMIEVYKRTLTSLLTKYQFVTVYTSYVGFYRSIKRVLFNLAHFKGGAWKRIYELYSRLEFKDFSCYLNAYDILFVMARKKT
jgi:hypothetical protein